MRKGGSQGFAWVRAGTSWPSCCCLGCEAQALDMLLCRGLRTWLDMPCQLRAAAASQRDGCKSAKCARNHILQLPVGTCSRTARAPSAASALPLDGVQGSLAANACNQGADACGRDCAVHLRGGGSKCAALAPPAPAPSPSQWCGWKRLTTAVLLRSSQMSRQGRAEEASVST